MKESNHWFALTLTEVLSRLESSRDGLSADEAARRLAQFGPNVIPEQPPKKLWVVYRDQFKNAFIYLLLIAAVVSLFLGEYGDALFIAAALQINAVIGTVQEWQAQSKALGLKHLVKSTLPVMRDGGWQTIDGRDLVPGDVVEVESGIQVPAAMRLLEDESLEVDESLLTGESLPVVKSADGVLESHAALADQLNMLQAGSTVMRGRGLAVVTDTGPRTEVGKVAEALKYRDMVTPPLIRRMETFTHIVAALMTIVIALIAGIEFLRGTELVLILMTSVALAVAAIPEGLPVALTVALSISVSRMAKRDVVVRKMAAVEGLGACTLIASDKTGTLTINELSVQQISLPDHTVFAVDAFTGGHIDVVKDDQRQQFDALVTCGLLCNEARLEQSDRGEHKLFGDTVDGALLKLGVEAGLDRSTIDAENPRNTRIPYEPALAFAASFHSRGDKVHAYVKGAAEVVLGFCTDIDHAAVISQVDGLAGQGYRVIALAAGAVQGMDREHLAGLNFLGLVALIDPLRPTAIQTIQRCRNAGMAVRMVTGDHPLTALEIGRQLDMADSEDDVVTGSQLASLQTDETAFDTRVAACRIFARVSPLQKLEIVKSLQRNGHIVAVTGDGVNDVAALSVADIGAAMGRSGTDIARSAADLILVKDELAALADGVEEGRIAYDNIRKVIYLLISTGAAELVLFFASIMVGLPLPLSPVQLLWLNLVTQGIQHVALAFEKGEPDVLSRKPRPTDEGIFNRQMIEQTVLSGLTVGLIGFLLFQSYLEAGLSLSAASNQLLLVLILFENAHVFNCRSETRSVFSIPLKNNHFLVGGVVLVQLIHITAMNIPGLSTVLDIAPLDFKTWLWSAMPAVAVVLVMELYKFRARAKSLS